MIIAWVVAWTSLGIWIFLIIGRGLFWLPRPQLNAEGATTDFPQHAPSVVAIIPARNEEDVIAESLATVLNQAYRGLFHVLLVNDRSEDATANIVHRVADSSAASNRVTVLDGKPLPKGWAGKVWAMHQGAQHESALRADYLWLTDADIAHDPGMLNALVRKASSENLDLVSLMAQLRVDSYWDRLLIPAFVYFFAKLYPFRLVNNKHRRTAGAAGGCILVNRETLAAAGGVEAIHSALIDDCALGRLIKTFGGRVWLGFTRSVWSVREYKTLRSVWDMVARSAFHQLNYSVVKLLGTLIGMLLIYAAPPVITIIGALAAAGAAQGLGLVLLGGATWMIMALSFVPILRHQQAPAWQAPLLPIAGTLYTAMTLSSAWRHITGRSGMWKGRPYVGGS